MTVSAFLAFLAVLAFVLSEAVRRVAVRRNVLDIPNERSSHEVPTPRGGGIAIALVIVGATLFLIATGRAPHWLLPGLCLPGAAIAAIGAADDIIRLPASLRLAVHALACALALWMLPVWQLTGAPTWLSLPLVMGPVVLLGLAWTVNLYNFMDGIDALAATEAVFLAIALALLLGLAGHGDFALMVGVVGAAAAGFLGLNWPPARLFMGDAGSGFLGFALGYLAIAAMTLGVGFWAALIMFGTFATDATVTLFARLLRGEKLHQAHRSHIYQRLARHWGAHRPVVLLYMGINLLWLAPLGVLAQSEQPLGAVLAVLAYAPLLAGSMLLVKRLPAR